MHSAHRDSKVDNTQWMATGRSMMQDEARKDSELRGEIKKKHCKNSIEAELNYAY